jgi:hypothetical protein
MKRILTAAVFAMIAGGAYAAGFDDLQTLKASDMKEASAAYNIKVNAPKAANASSAFNIVDLYKVWTENDWGGPTDKKLVEDQMHRSLKVTTDRNALVLIRAMLSIEIRNTTNAIDQRNSEIAYLCTDLRSGPGNTPTEYTSLTDAEIVAKVLAKPVTASGDQWVWSIFTERSIREGVERIKEPTARRKDVLKERDMVDAKLAELK